MAKHELDPDQSPLFEASLTPGGNLETWKDVQPVPEPVSIQTVLGPEGSYVDISDRAELLESSLRAIGKANQRVGLADAAEVPPHRAGIWGRYTRQTDRVLEGANRNREAFQDDAKRKFWEATGLAAMQGAGLINKETRDALGRTMWRDFSQQYGGVGQLVAKRRQKAARSYSKQIREP